ncbi:hypothetical protein BH23BAC2_BH23BAC2_23350 [soil metagenome]
MKKETAFLDSLFFISLVYRILLAIRELFGVFLKIVCLINKYLTFVQQTWPPFAT